MITWSAPAWLYMLPAIVPLIMLRSRSTIFFSHLPLIALPQGRTWRVRLLPLLALARGAWLALVVLALADPRALDPSSARYQPSQAIILVVDASGSSAAIETATPAGPQTRLALAQALVHDFVAAGAGGRAPGSSQLGLVAVARWPKLLAPLTSEPAYIAPMVDALTIDPFDNRTNLGDSLALAMELLAHSDGVSRHIVLLSDGAHNVPGVMSPLEAARIAKALDVTIHCVSIRWPKAEWSEEERSDEQTLEQIAKNTGGSFRNAATSGAGRSLAAELASRAPLLKDVEYRKRIALWPALVLGALAGLLFEAILRGLVFRTPV